MFKSMRVAGSPPKFNSECRYHHLDARPDAHLGAWTPFWDSYRYLVYRFGVLLMPPIHVSSEGNFFIPARFVVYMILLILVSGIAVPFAAPVLALRGMATSLRSSWTDWAVQPLVLLLSSAPLLLLFQIHRAIQAQDRFSAVGNSKIELAGSFLCCWVVSTLFLGDVFRSCTERGALHMLTNELQEIDEQRDFLQRAGQAESGNAIQDETVDQLHEFLHFLNSHVRLQFTLSCLSCVGPPA